MEFGKRLTLFMLEKDLSVDQLSKITETSLSAIYDWRNGKKVPNTNYLMKISEAHPELNMDWLITGRGKMMYSNKAEKVTNNESSVENRLSELENKIDQLLKTKDDTSNLASGGVDPFLAMFQMLNQMAKNNGMKLTINADDQPANRQSGKLAGDTDMSEAEKEIESLNYWVEEYPKRNHNVAA
ncbi:hypothetical protein V6R21_07570 [Limibacter armeniacum]|uniref:helix-turn-helix domain-containing protein n=1 Tax=Limibacter armeniacum TaxID=466084 RepID=UPI002FE62202